MGKSIFLSWLNCAHFHCDYFPSKENDETALHLAIDQEEDGTTLHLVDFILQNSNK